MTPRTFVDDVAHVNSARFLASKNNLRLAINAVMTIDAAVDVLFADLSSRKDPSVARYQSTDGYKDALAADNQDYALIRRLATALRHGRFDEAGVKITQGGAGGGSSMQKFFANRSALNSRSVTIEGDGTARPADEIVLGADMLLSSLLMRHAL